nr:hypothetical protein CFP56_32209 [Quercus suber]
MFPGCLRAAETSLVVQPEEEATGVCSFTGSHNTHFQAEQTTSLYLDDVRSFVSALCFASAESLGDVEFASGVVRSGARNLVRKHFGFIDARTA